MNLVSIAIVLGPHQFSILEQGEALVLDIKAIFPEGEVALSTTGVVLQQRLTEIPYSRQKEITKHVLVDAAQADSIAKDILKASIEESAVADSASFFTAIFIIVAFLIAVALAIYVVGQDTFLAKASFVVEHRRPSWIIPKSLQVVG